MITNCDTILIMSDDKVQCLECGCSFGQLTVQHLKKHSLTSAEYLAKHPGAKMVSATIAAKRSAQAKKVNSVRDYSEIGTKVSMSKKGKASIRKGVSLSDEAKARITEGVRRHRASSEYVAPRTGATLSSEVKAKIANSLYDHPDNIASRERWALLKLTKEQELANRLAEKVRDQEATAASIGLEIVNKTISHANLRCITCGHTFVLTLQYLDACRLPSVTCQHCKPRTSIIEQELQRFVSGLCSDTAFNDRTVLGGKELDVYVPSKGLAFEMNGLYWHSELNRGDPHHMLWKQQHARTKGVQVIHIFEDEWVHRRSIVENRVRHLLGDRTMTTAYARQGKIVEINNQVKNEFLSVNHLQGADISRHRYGLLIRDELVAVMTFKRTSYVKGGDGQAIELNRFAVKLGYHVPGAAGKLLSRFIQDQRPDKIISYADRRWSVGRLYEALGFKFVRSSKPSYWYMKGYQQRFHRSGYMKHTLDPNSELTEWEQMQARGYDRIWDCGTVLFELNLDKYHHEAYRS